MVVTSDMYLSEDIIRRILTKNGFEGYTNIFVSSEFGEKKRNGKLFKRVVDELRVKPKEILPQSKFQERLHILLDVCI